MRLKRVNIFGFKTFADKTEITVDGSITAVVGPNGCGKSNIVDAILWGLGESNARHLRAGSAKEVIFAGSVHRKPLGYAEVTLVFDNEDGSLPMASPEVAVTRRLTRSGESEYAINRRSCRLRDVADLLADSGLGRAGYAIVGQSEIDQALAASPQQRRAWIDEAAGVQRYRARRQESVRRLQAAQEHLARVRDILAEIETQREPLELEAQSAREYKAILSSLREVECSLLIKELDAAVRELAELGERITGAMKLADAESKRAESLEDQARKAYRALAETESQIEDLRGRQAAAQAAIEQAGAALQVAQHKLQTLDLLEGSLEQESAAGKERLMQAEADLIAARQEQDQESAAYERLQAELAGIDAVARGLTKTLQEAEAGLLQARAAAAEAQKIAMEAAHRKARAAQVRTEIAGIDQTLPELKQGIAEAESDLAEKTGRVEAAQSEAKKCQERLQEIASQDSQDAQITRELLAELASLEGRKRGIEATIESHEGLGQGPKAVLAAVKEGRLRGEFSLVGDSLNVEPRLSVAIDTALGAASGDLIVADEATAKEAIEFLKEGRLGRATFQPLTLMRAGEPGADLRKLSKERGVLGIASDLVTCKEQHRPVIESLLGRIVVVEDLDVALRLARSSGWQRLVTLDGEVVFNSGAVSGGRSQRSNVGAVQRRAELAEISTQIDAAQAQVERVEDAREARDATRRTIEAEISAAKELEREAHAECEETRSWLLGLRHELASTERGKERLLAELESLTSILDEPTVGVDVAKLESERDEALKALAARSADSDQIAERLRDAEARAAAASVRTREAERRLANLQATEENRQRRFENLEPERERHRAQIAEAEAASQKAKAASSQVTERLEATLADKRRLIEESQRYSEEAKSALRSASDHAETVHRSELARARADARRAAATERLLEEYGVGQDEALAKAPEITVPKDAQSLVHRLRKELKGMGEVNLGAIEAYDRLTERHSELSQQSADIESGMAEVTSGIRELDRLTKERFRETFDALQVAFGEMFRKTFGGGEGTLELEDTDNILDSGVEIQVTVPGKRRQRLELLSGGERALSALAFLFALLKVKPSPLVILDEVDAPLDGRNVERFVGMLRDFSAESQFILITHNPVTIEAADVWFGVTMQEPGVSTFVPFKVPTPGLTHAVVPDAYLKG